jgi:hypothetical protein
MYESMRRVMAANEGLITAGQARDCGLSSTQITQLVRVGALWVVRHGVYVDIEVWTTTDEHRGRPRLRTRAAIATMRRGFVVSHESSAHEHDLDILTPPDPFVHITRPGSTAAWARAGVKHHLAGFSLEQVEIRNGLEVMDLARTAVDIARELGPPYGEVACDAAMRRGLTRAQLEAAFARMASWPNVTRVRRAVEFADPGAQTVIETLGRCLVDDAGLGVVETQFPYYREDGRVAWADMRVGCHLIETHGKIKFLATDDGGVSDRPAREAEWNLRKRDRETFRLGLGTSHVYWEDCWDPRRPAALKRLREEYDDTVRRFGTRLPERLAHQAREIRGSRGA